jgi:hypothetical protein
MYRAIDAAIQLSEHYISKWNYEISVVYIPISRLETQRQSV